MTSIAAALAAARSAGLAALDAQLLLARATGLGRTGVVAHGERALSAGEEASWGAWLQRRLAGEPLAYVLGEKEFCGLPLEVDHAVLVPRPETELLVEWASTLEAPGGQTAEVVDLGTGSGAIALALKHGHSGWRLTATDVSRAALAVAARNAARLGLALELVESDWWQGLAGRRFDIAVANPPYIAAGDLHLAALKHEPEAALTPGVDGLGALAAIVAGAADHLRPGGWLILEHGFDQGGAVRFLFKTAGFEAVETRPDLAGLPRATAARWPSPSPRRRVSG